MLRMARLQMQPQTGIRSGGQHRHQHVPGTIDAVADIAAVGVLLQGCNPHIVQQLNLEDLARIRPSPLWIAPMLSQAVARSKRTAPGFRPQRC